MPSSISTHRKRLAAFIVALAVLILGVSGAVAIGRHGSRPIHIGFVGRPGAAAQIAFLGDSYTFGYGATEHADGYAYDVARAEHWSATVVGIPGSGYARVAPRYDTTIAGGIDTILAAHPRVLVVECGHNDAQYGSSPTATRRDALRDLRLLRARLPRTHIVVLGPVWLDSTPSAHALAIRNAVHAAQRAVPGTLWIDPIAQRWFIGRLENHSGDDATMINLRVGHPNDAGYAHMASRLTRDLRALGIR